MSDPSAIDVRIRHVDLPPNAILEWQRHSYTRCACGWEVEEHPLCCRCSVMIGPNHVERHGRSILVDVYIDVFDHAEGVWYLDRVQESFFICRACVTSFGNDPVTVQPFRRPTSAKKRLSVVNAWRRRHHLPALKLADVVKE